MNAELSPNDLDMSLETLDTLEAPMSWEWYVGVGLGFAAGVGVGVLIT